MQKTQEQVTHMFRRAYSFVVAHPELIADTPEGRRFAARLDALGSTIASIDAAAAAQVTATAQSRVVDSKEPELKRLLREVHLRSIATVARSLTHVVPGIGVLQLPSAQLRNAALITRATAFVEQARTYESVLIEYGLSPDAIPKLERAIAAFHDSVAGRRAARTNLVTATHAIRGHLDTGRAIVTGMDGVIRIVLDGHNDALAGWHSAKRVGRVGRGPVGADVDTLSKSAHGPSTSVQTRSSAARSLSTSDEGGATSAQPPAPAVTSGAAEVKHAA